MELFIIIGLVLLNGFFALSEIVLVSAKKYKLENAKKKGIRGAKTALELSEHPTRFLSTVQIGITFIGILLGIYSGETITKNIALHLQNVSILAPYAEKIALGLNLIFITYLSIVLGELFPKRLGMTFPDKIAIFVAKPMQILSQLTAPFVWLLSRSNDLLLSLFGIKKNMDSTVSEDEIKSIVKESAEDGAILDIEHSIVERVFELGDRKIKTLFTHRSEIVYFNITDDWATVSNKINTSKHSTYPVCKDNNMDNIIGIILLKDLFQPNIEKNFDLKNYLQEPLYFSENIDVYKVLDQFKKAKIPYGVVVDEYGATQGVVTANDVLNALVSSATEIYYDDYKITERADGSWLVDGQYDVLDFLRFFNLGLEGHATDKFSTVAGLVISHSGRLPKVGEKIYIDPYTIEIIDKDGQRIDKLLVTKHST